MLVKLLQGIKLHINLDAKPPKVIGKSIGEIFIVRRRVGHKPYLERRLFRKPAVVVKAIAGFL